MSLLNLSSSVYITSPPNPCVFSDHMYGRKRRYGSGSYKGGHQGRYTKRRRVVGNKSWLRSGGSSGRSLRGGPSQISIPATIGIPGRTFVKLRTCYNSTLTSTSGVFATGVQVKMNSIFDPAGTVGAITATGYTNWANLYQSYIVHSCSVRITLAANTGTAPPMMVCIYPKANSTTTSASMTEARGQPWAKYVQTAPTMGVPAKVGFFVTMAQTAGQSKQTIATDDSFAALIGADPASLLVTSLCIQTLDQATTASIFATYDVIQYVEFFNAKKLN